MRKFVAAVLLSLLGSFAALPGSGFTITMPPSSGITPVSVQRPGEREGKHARPA